MTYGLHDPELHRGTGVYLCTLCDWSGTRWALWHEFRASIGESNPIAAQETDPE